MLTRMQARIRWRAAVAASALALSPVILAAEGQAQEAAAPAVAPATAGGWNKFCTTQGEREICSVVFQIIAEGGQFIAQAALNQETGTNQILLSIMVRTGLLIQPGIQVQVDNNAPTAVPILLCDPSICISETEVDQNFVNALKAGGTLTLSTLAPDANQPNGARQNNFPMTLVGFTATYDGPGMTPDQAQARQDELNQALQDRAAAARQRLIEQQQQATTPAATPPAAP